jgi:hypothetical protein
LQSRGAGAILASDEFVVWQGRPSVRLVFLHSLPLAAAGLALGAASFVLLNAYAADLVAASVAALFLVGSVILAVFVPLAIARRTAGTEYWVTNRRVGIVVHGGQLRRFVSRADVCRVTHGRSLAGDATVFFWARVPVLTTDGERQALMAFYAVRGFDAVLSAMRRSSE